PANEIGPGKSLRIALSGREQLVEPPHTFSGGARDPVPTHRCDEICSMRKVPAVHASAKYPPDVVDLELHPFQPLDEPVARLGCRLHTPRPVVINASVIDGFLFGGLSQLKPRILAHRFVEAAASEALDVLFR